MRQKIEGSVYTQQVSSSTNSAQGWAASGAELEVEDAEQKK